MENFNDIEHLVSYMFEKLDNEDNLVSVIAGKEMIVAIMHELLNYENVILNSCDIDDDYDYGREYIVTLFDDIDSDNWYVNVEKCYSADKNRYFSIDGYVLFHEDVNSKAMIDMQNSELAPLGEHDWFTIGEEEDSDIDDNNDTEDYDPDPETDDEEADSGYIATIKVGLDTDEAERLMCVMDKGMKRELFGIFDMLYRPHLYEYRPIPIRFFY